MVNRKVKYLNDAYQFADAVLSGGVGTFLFFIGQTTMATIPIFWCGFRLGCKLTRIELAILKEKKDL